MKMNVKIKDLEPIHVAYVRHIGAFKGNAKLFEKLFGTLCTWAGPRNLLNEKASFLSIYHDDPNITAEDKLRLDVAISIPKDTGVSGEIGKLQLPGGKYAVAHFELRDPSEYEAAWNSFYHDWLPESGYQPDQRPSLEIYLNDPKNDPGGKHIVEFCIPVKSL